MEDNIRLKTISRNQQFLGTAERTVTSQARLNANFQHRSKPGKPNLSYTDVHHEITKNAGDISSKPLGNHQKQHRRAIEEEELVKYMSKLPSYLERGQTPQEKVLNVGVLDWSQLEKWHCSQKPIPSRNSRHSLSSSNSLSPFSTEGSSVHSSSGQSCSPGRERTRRPSLHFHLMSSPKNDISAIESFGGSLGGLQDVKGSQNSTVTEQTKCIKLDPCKRKYMDQKVNPERGTLADGLNYDMLQCRKTMTKTTKKTQEDDFLKRAGKSQVQKAYFRGQDVDQMNERVVLLPRDFQQGNHSGVCHKSTMMLDQMEEEEGPRSFTDMPPEVFLPTVSPDVPHSCPLRYENGGQLERKAHSVDAMNVSCLADSSRPVPHQAKIGTRPSQATVSKVRKPTAVQTDPSSKESSVGSDWKMSKFAADKVRSTSPFRRISISMSKISKSFSSKEGSSRPQLSSIYSSAQSGSENANSGTDTQIATSMAWSSPLRRLLDPMLKPKAANFHPSGEPLHRGLITTDRVCKSSSVQFNCVTGTPQVGMVKSDMTPSSVSVSDSSKNKKHIPSSFQALLRVAVKNDQPIFTFAVDNERGILAATVKKLSTSREDDCSCIYTFFAIQDIKKKNARWINQGGKGKGHNYIPNVVAQLKVSGSQFPNLSKRIYMAQSFVREFILFALDLPQADQHVLDFQPNNELAAIVVEIPRVINRTTIRDPNQTEYYNSSEARRNSTSRNVWDLPIFGSQNIISTAVVLPSGTHSLPSKGGPSSLLQRWRSGGSCDCGGWDLGCKLRILVNQNQPKEKSRSPKACSAEDKFELVAQGGEENQTVFSMALFKEGIYSIEFDASFSTLQAFSVCLAVLDGKKLMEVSESRNSVEEKTSLETVLVQNDGIWAAKGMMGEVPTRYVSYPPLSPIGRV